MRPSAIFRDVRAAESDDAAVFAPTQVEILSRSEIMRCLHWARAFSRSRKDHRYYEIVEDTLCHELTYRYFALRNSTGEIVAVQPFFLLDQDLLAGLGPGIGRAVGIVRTALPGFMRLRTLMLGCAAGEGHLDATDHPSAKEIATLLATSLDAQARKLKARLIVFKEFPSTYRELLECLVVRGYRRIPSLPAVRLDIAYRNFEEYLNHALSRNARMHLRRNLRASERPPSIEVEVVHDVTPYIDLAYPLYRQVFERSAMRFELLSKAYFCELGRRMPDRVRFFLWRRAGRLVAFSTCMIEGDTFCAEYLGLDYAVALDLHLYFRVFRDEVSWAMANGFRWYRSGQLGYDPKLHLGFRLEPLDLYVRHTSGILNKLMNRALPLMSPTRANPSLPKFVNYSEL